MDRVNLDSKSDQKIDTLLEQWKSDESIKKNIVLKYEEMAHPADLVSFPAILSEDFSAALMSLGIHQLYSHQVKAWNAIRSGRNIIITTGTSSGKTISYNLPILEDHLAHGENCYLYLFPTKALAQDQEKSLLSLFSGLKNRVNTSRLLGIYDGDTPQAKKKRIRDSARFVFTNPDMLHIGILPYHTAWARFFRKLKYVVIDETHTYRGIFGSHVANLIRRFKRVANFYGVTPQFLMTSATIANPKEFAEKLIESPVEIIDEDGSPRGRKTYILYNPPIIQKELSIRQNPSSETIRLCSDLLANNIQSLIFTRSRKSVEFTLKNLQLNFPDRIGEIAPYRSGYLPKERRLIERRIREGISRIIVSTNALELGIDIGSLDSILMVGYPGTTTAFKQQSGRAGRKNKRSLVVLVASSNPLDQFLLNNPEYLFTKPVENALINPDNLLILLQHLRCAIYELPFSSTERFGNVDTPTIKALLDALMMANNIHTSNNKYFWVNDSYPAGEVSLRTTSERNYILQTKIKDRMIKIGEIDETSAYWMVHPGAIYLHAGQIYHVEEMDIQKAIVNLQQGTEEYFTEPKHKTSIERIHTFRQEIIPLGEKFYGEILVRSQVTGYRKLEWITHDVLNNYLLDLPETKLMTTAAWIRVGDNIIDDLRLKNLWSNDRNYYGANWQTQRKQALKRDNFTCQVCGRISKTESLHVHHREPFRNFTSFLEANQLSNLVSLCSSCHIRAETMVKVKSGLGGISYVFHHLAPLILMCDFNDIGVLSDANSAITEGNPSILIYDQIPAGIGLSESIYNRFDILIRNALQLVSECKCQDGCPSCVGAPAEKGTGAKIGTLALLQSFNE